MSDSRYEHQPLDQRVPRTVQTCLVRVMEECGEATQEAAKILRFGLWNYHPLDARKLANIQRLRAEIADINRAMQQLEGLLNGGQGIP